MNKHIFVMGTTKFISVNNRHDYKSCKSTVTGRFHVWENELKKLDDVKISFPKEKIDYIIWEY